jgi:hypothetical protein
MSQETRSPSLGEVINRALEQGTAEIRVSLPCVVETWDGAQTVSVKPQIQDQFIDDNGVQQNEVLPVIQGVPVEWPGGGGFQITFPLQPGDTGLIVFCDRSIELWMANGGDTAPADARRHHISDAIFRPGLKPNPSAVTVDPSALVLGQANQPPDFVALASKVLTQLGDIVTGFNKHVHTVPDGTSDVPTVLMPDPSSVASGTVKILG